MNKREVTMEWIKEQNVDVWEVKDNSPRGCKTVTTSELSVGDKVVIDNHFTKII